MKIIEIIHFWVIFRFENLVDSNYLFEIIMLKVIVGSVLNEYTKLPLQRPGRATAAVPRGAHARPHRHSHPCGGGGHRAVSATQVII